jgi:hypothetical protein
MQASKNVRVGRYAVRRLGKPRLTETDPKRCQLAIEMWKNGAKGHTIYKELRIGYDTLNKILTDAGEI